MKILHMERSSEDCQQAGWLAYDLFLSKPVDAEQILRWQTLGDLVYLRQLRQPFYRVAGRDFLLKGLEGQEKLRLAFADGFLPRGDAEAAARFLNLSHIRT